MRPICASVITIGDELLIGQRTDTNSQWICSELNKIGATVSIQLSIRDEADAIKSALDIARSKSEIILITGGLGPTKDDITKKTLSNYFGSDLIMDEIVLQDVTDYFTRRGKEMNAIQNAQALVPSNSVVIRNHRGTAPGMWFDTDNKITVSMPGVPLEMKYMMTNEILDKLKNRFSLNTIIDKTISTIGIGESSAANIIASIENSLPENIKIAYLPTAGAVKIRLSGLGVEEKVIESYMTDIAKELKEYVYAHEDTSIEEIIASKLTSKNKTISTAESCTGGYLAHQLTKISGSSKYYIGSILAYSNDIKIQELGINKEILNKNGAVSEEVVIEMAQNIRVKFNTDYGLSTSGIAGPTGGTKDKPVGTVWIACASKTETITKLLHLTNDRLLNIELSAIAVLDLLRQSLQK